MESLSRVSLYDQMLESRHYEGRQEIALRTNKIILDGVESAFLSNDASPEGKRDKDPIVRDNLEANIARVRGSELYRHREVERLLRKLNKAMDDYRFKNEVIDKNSRNLFNKVINELGEFNDIFFPSGEFPTLDADKHGKTQVFFSHAYDDKLYSYALYRYFYRRGVYLYVDWMHSGKQTNGIVLKNDLERELNNSEQLLFLRTINSELDIQGKHMLRSWCAWELGNFYRKQSDEKYMINLYSVDSYYKDFNLQIHGLKRYTDVVGNRLTGVVIVP